jgi:ATP-dependent protease Clp ATPase subunit
MSKRVTIYGVGGRPPRICNQCISLCLDILEEQGRKVPGAGDWLDQQAVLADPGRGAARIAREAYRKELEHLFGEERAKMTASETKLGDLRRQGIFPTGCSFCERPTDEVENLIAGPATYICDRCVGGVLSLSGALVTLARE